MSSAGQSIAERRRVHQKLIQSPPSDLNRLGAECDALLIGYVDLHGDEPHRRELGFLIGERGRWGHGLGRLAAAAGLDHGFDRLGLREIWAQALAANRRSVRIRQRLGLTELGRGDDGAYLDQPTYYRRFLITSAEWTRRRAANPTP